MGLGGELSVKMVWKEVNTIYSNAALPLAGIAGGRGWAGGGCACGLRTLPARRESLPEQELWDRG